MESVMSSQVETQLLVAGHRASDGGLFCTPRYLGFVPLKWKMAASVASSLLLSTNSLLAILRLLEGEGLGGGGGGGEGRDPEQQRTTSTQHGGGGAMAVC